jgi:hypothetical protein
MRTSRDEWRKRIGRLRCRALADERSRQLVDGIGLSGELRAAGRETGAGIAQRAREEPLPGR